MIDMSHITDLGMIFDDSDGQINALKTLRRAAYGTSRNPVIELYFVADEAFTLAMCGPDKDFRIEALNSADRLIAAVKNKALSDGKNFTDYLYNMSRKYSDDKHAGAGCNGFASGKWLAVHMLDLIEDGIERGIIDREMIGSPVLQNAMRNIFTRERDVPLDKEINVTLLKLVKHGFERVLLLASQKVGEESADSLSKALEGRTKENSLDQWIYGPSAASGQVLGHEFSAKLSAKLG